MGASFITQALVEPEVDPEVEAGLPETDAVPEAEPQGSDDIGAKTEEVDARAAGAEGHDSAVEARAAEAAEDARAAQADEVQDGDSHVVPDAVAEVKDEELEAADAARAADDLPVGADQV